MNTPLHGDNLAIVDPHVPSESSDPIYLGPLSQKDNIGEKKWESGRITEVLR